MTYDHKNLTRCLHEDVLGRKEIARLDEIVAPDAVDHLARGQGWPAGRAGFRRHIAFLHDVFSGLRITVDELVAEGDRVIAFWSLDGIHSGSLWGVEPTGRRITGSTVSIVTFHHGRVVEYESRPDRLEFLLQLGSAGDYTRQLALEIA